MPRGKKIAVNPKERRDWLNRIESGEGITLIAKQTKRDVRTVRDNIEIAKVERRRDEAEKEHLLEVIKRHQEKLLAEVARVRSTVGSYPPGAIITEDSEGEMVHEALMGHLKRTKLKPMIESLVKFVAEDSKIKERVEKSVRESERDTVSKLPEGIETVHWAMDILAALYSGDLDDADSLPDYVPDEIKPGMYWVKWAGHTLTLKQLPENNLSPVIETHKNLVAQARRFIGEIGKQRHRLEEMAVPVKKELGILLMKEYVSGRCEYCPI